MKNSGTYRIGFSVSISPPEKGELEGVTQKGIHNNVTHPNLPFSGKGYEQIIFEYSTSRSTFIEVPYTSGMQIDEEYWLDDVLDFLDGRQELYSNFWHRLNPKTIYRLWTCLGANFCNNELVISKYRLHFERAKRGETSNSFFEEIKKSLI